MNVLTRLLIIVILVSPITCDLYTMKRPKYANPRPVIGIMLQTIDNQTYGKYYTYSSFVRWSESAGAMVVPIRVNQTVEYYHNLMDKINGAIWPGGHVNRSVSGYARAVRIMFHYAKKLNDEGKYFPIWGVCLGFQMMAELQAERRPLVEPCAAHDLNIPLVLGPDHEKSTHLSLMPKDLKRMLTHDNYADHFHVRCIFTDVFYNSSLKDFFYLSAVNTDLNGTAFVSSIEAKNYPFYGLAFHPEKFNFVFQPDIHPAHNLHSVRISQYFANFFITEARKSKASFESDEELFKHVISHYRTVWVGLPKAVEFFEFFDHEF